MKKTARLFTTVLVCTLGVITADAFGFVYAINYNDGGLHVLDESFQNIQVDYRTANRRTSVIVQDGASGEWIHGYKESNITIQGGVINECWALDRSHFTLSGGILGGIRMHDESTIHITGGQINRLLPAFDNTTVNISGGSLIEGLIILNSSSGVISGGTLGQLTVADYSHAFISGGTFDLIQAGSYWDKGYGHHSLRAPLRIPF